MDSWESMKSMKIEGSPRPPYNTARPGRPSGVPEMGVGIGSISGATFGRHFGDPFWGHFGDPLLVPFWGHFLAPLLVPFWVPPGDRIWCPIYYSCKRYTFPRPVLALERSDLAIPPPGE